MSKMQYHETEGSDAGHGEIATYKRLWAGVMLQAVRDYGQMIRVDEGANRGGSMPFNGNKLSVWFLSNEMGVGDFAWICSLFNLDPGACRAKVFTNPAVLYDRHMGSPA